MTMKKNLFAALLAVAAVALTANSSLGLLWPSVVAAVQAAAARRSWGSRGSLGFAADHGAAAPAVHGALAVGSYGSCGSCGSYGGGYSSVSYGYTTVAMPQRVSRPCCRESLLAAAPAVKTRLTLRVPAEAKVTLAGVETKQAGEVRQFATTKLSSGQVWDDYKVVVEMNRDGQTLREERTIKLTGGQDQELAVNFDSNKTNRSPS